MDRITTRAIIGRYGFLLLFLMMSCSSDKFPHKVMDFINEECVPRENSDSCVISLNRLVTFNWDYLYIFDTGFEGSDISDMIGIDCNCTGAPDDYSLVIFTSGENIVYKETYDNLALGGDDFSFINCDMEEGAIKISKKNSDFYVRIWIRDFNKVNYILSPYLNE